MVNHIKKIAGFFTLAMVLTFAGCSGLVNGSVSTDDSTSYGSIGIELAGVTSRAAMAPTTLTVDGAEIKAYTVSGVSKTGLTYAAVDFTPAEVKGGEKKLEAVPKDDWTFTMTAYSDTEKTKPILQGTSVCNMKSAGASTVTFTLSSYSLSTNGAYNITIKYAGTAWKDGVYSFSWGLYDPITGETLGTVGTAGTAVTTVGATEAVAIKTGDDYYLAAAPAVKPGSYIFGVYIYNGDTKLGFASEGLVIEPGRTTTATLTLDPNIIQSAPTAPANLIAQRVDGSINDDFYDVRFAWQDKSNNEESFEFVVRTFTTTSDDWPVSGADATIENTNLQQLYTWSSILTLTKSTDKVKYVAGSLYAGSQELVLRFPTGTLYDVQIRSVNSVGKSATIARTADTNPGTTGLEVGTATEEAPSPTTAKTFLTSYEGKKVIGIGIGESTKNIHISLVKITYFLDGGTLKLANTATGSTKIYVDYKPYALETDGEDDAHKYIPLLTIVPAEGAAASANTLVRDGIDWSKWILSSAATLEPASQTAQTYNTAAYKDFSVLAIYGSTSGDITVSSATIVALAHASFTDASLTAYYGNQPTTAMAANDCKNKQIKIPWGSAAQYVTVTVATNELFTRYVLYVGEYPIEEKAYAETSINFSNFSTDRLASGGASTCIRVDAFTAGGEMGSASFYIQKVN